MVVWWNPTSLRDIEQNLCNPKHMEIALPGKDSLYDKIQFGALVYPNAKSDEYYRWKGFRGSGMEKARDIFRMGVGRSDAQRDNMKVLFTSLMDIKCRVRSKLQNFEGRGVLRGDIVKDDAGAHSVSTEQGPCASHMISAKIMEDHIAGKGTIHQNITTWYTNLFLCLKPRRFPQQRQWTKNGRNLNRFRRGT